MKYTTLAKKITEISLIFLIPVGVLLGLAGSARAGGDAAESPLVSDLEETVKIRLVMLDSLVVDRDGRTVPDLQKEDFDLFVAGEQTEISTFDVSCPIGSVGDAKGVRHRRGVPAAPNAPRNVVVVTDYMHLGQIEVAEALDHIKKMVAQAKPDAERMMLIALTGGIRVELPFTSDKTTIVDALHRMQHDISLWAGNYSHIRDDRFFEGILTIFSMLETMPGRKAMVLYSNIYNPAEGEYDREFSNLAAEATTSRTAIYPVHVEGLAAGPPPG